MRQRSGVAVLGVGVLGASLLAACDDVRSCTAKACGGYGPSLRLVDETGAAVTSARGQYRRGGEGEQTTPFDCQLGARAEQWPGCTAGVVERGDFWNPSVTAWQIRFVADDGSWTAWQRFELELEKHTDPDFNGPGCSCTWYNASADPILVPADARQPPPPIADPSADAGPSPDASSSDAGP